MQPNVDVNITTVREIPLSDFAKNPAYGSEQTQLTTIGGRTVLMMNKTEDLSWLQMTLRRILYCITPAWFLSHCKWLNKCTRPETKQLVILIAYIEPLSIYEKICRSFHSCFYKNDGKTRLLPFSFELQVCAKHVDKEKRTKAFDALQAQAEKFGKTDELFQAVQIQQTQGRLEIPNNSKLHTGYITSSHYKMARIEAQWWRDGGQDFAPVFTAIEKENLPNTYGFELATRAYRIALQRQLTPSQQRQAAYDWAEKFNNVPLEIVTEYLKALTPGPGAYDDLNNIRTIYNKIREGGEKVINKYVEDAIQYTFADPDNTNRPHWFDLRAIHVATGPTGLESFFKALDEHLALAFRKEIFYIKDLPPKLRDAFGDQLDTRLVKEYKKHLHENPTSTVSTVCSYFMTPPTILPTHNPPEIEEMLTAIKKRDQATFNVSWQKLQTNEKPTLPFLWLAQCLREQDKEQIDALMPGPNVTTYIGNKFKDYDPRFIDWYTKYLDDYLKQVLRKSEPR